MIDEAAAHGWIRDRLDDLGTPVTGPIATARSVPWSVTMRAPTAAGVRWFKANAPGCAYEAVLAEALGRWVPGEVLEPLAVDAGRGWLLTADLGRTLRETLDPADRPRVWAAMLRAYGKLQLAVSGRSERMIALGVPDVRVPRLPERLAALLADRDVRAQLGPERLAAVAALEPAFRDWCAELAEDGLPASVQHDDLHDDNVFAGGRHGFRFFDWGDAGVGHPFGSLLVTLGFADEPLRPGLRDAYLAEWAEFASPAALLRSAELARRVGPVSRALAWQRALRDAGEVDESVRTAVGDWLAQLITHR